MFTELFFFQTTLSSTEGVSLLDLHFVYEAMHQRHRYPLSEPCLSDGSCLGAEHMHRSMDMPRNQGSHA
jgi:hypothetical protein